MKKMLLILTMTTLPYGAWANETMKQDREAVNTSCISEAQTAGCGNEKVGQGLLKCLHGYKKSHKDFKFSDNCKTAMSKLREDRKELNKEAK